MSTASGWDEQMIDAACEGRTEDMNTLLDRGANLDACGGPFGDGSTAAQAAVRRGGPYAEELL